ncbi:Uncharacterized protein dnm_042590 [Desulfonema magnum]|uniref:Uncharacterized protein n=1 Tax=Desulfonema magnum TaxID=45655 RepID=A0A975BMX3_9BACT|nr:Uncharacterized protein dnm_042590 [Desulfonema magnum]
MSDDHFSPPMSCLLFLPMRGYEVRDNPHNLTGKDVISPHEGL